VFDNRWHLPEDEELRQRMIEQREQLQKDFRYLVGALAGTCLIFIAAIVAVKATDIPLTMALDSFVLGLPALTGAAVYADYLPQYKGVWKLFGVGSVAVCFGIGATVWHASLIAGIAYVVAAIVVYGMQYTKGFNLIRRDFKFGFLEDYYSGQPRFFGPEWREEQQRRREQRGELSKAQDQTSASNGS